MLEVTENFHLFIFQFISETMLAATTEGWGVLPYMWSRWLVRRTEYEISGVSKSINHIYIYIYIYI